MPGQESDLTEDLLRAKAQWRAELLGARDSFWEFCRLLAPDFYRPERRHLYDLCNVLQDFYQGRLGTRKLMLNIPPQHGKTRTLTNFCKWILGRNPAEKIITASYNDFTAIDFSKYTRDGIMEVSQASDQVVYSDIFPDTRLKQGEASAQKWALAGQHFSYLGAGIGGSITSKGGTVLIIDDPVKGAEEALNQNYLDKIWLWYTGTFISRVSAEGGEPLLIVCHTRWSDNDLAGRLLRRDPKGYHIFRREAMNEHGEMLCPDLLSRKAYEDRKDLMVTDNITQMIFYANYHQRIVDTGNLLYRTLKTYADLPKDDQGRSLIREVRNYTDTADTGEDFLCSINYGIYNNQVYILNVLYTDDPMEITEPQMARMLTEDRVNLSTVESNAGGRGFARAVQERCRRMGNNRTVVNWVHQSANKEVRIQSNSHWVIQNMFFPANWMDRWPKFYEAVTTYQRTGKNRHDDAPDALTGIVESLVSDKILIAKVV